MESFGDVLAGYNFSPNEELLKYSAALNNYGTPDKVSAPTKLDALLANPTMANFGAITSNPDFIKALATGSKLFTNARGYAESPFQRSVAAMAQGLGGKAPVAPTPSPTPQVQQQTPTPQQTSSGFQQASQVPGVSPTVESLGTSLSNPLQPLSSDRTALYPQLSGIDTALMIGALDNPWDRRNPNLGFNTTMDTLHKADTAQTARKLADVQAIEADIKRKQYDLALAMQPYDQIAKYGAAVENLMKAGTYDPEYHGKVKGSETKAELEAKLEDRKKFAGSAQGQLPISKAHLAMLPALASFKTYGEAALAGYDLKEIDTNYVKRVDAGMAAGAISSAAANQLLAQQKSSLTDRLRMTDSSIVRLLGQQQLVMEESQKAAIKTELDNAYSERSYLDKQLKDLDKFYAGKTGATGTPGKAGAEKREAAKGGEKYTEKEIVVNGYKIPAGSTYKVEGGKVFYKKGK